MTVRLHLHAEGGRRTVNQIDSAYPRGVSAAGRGGTDAPVPGAKLRLLPLVIECLRLFADFALLAFWYSDQAEVLLLQFAVDTAGDAQQTALVEFVNGQRPDSATPRAAL